MTSRRRWTRGVGCLLLLVLAAGGAWLARGSLGGWMERLEIGAPSEPSERLAGAVEEKLDRLAREGLTGEVRLSEVELQSVLTYRAAPALPAGVEDPRIDVQDSIVVMSARIRPDRLEGFVAPESLLPLLADTSRFYTGLVPEVRTPGSAHIAVRSLRMGEFTVPPVLLPILLRNLRAQGVPTSGDAVRVPVPRSVRSIRIEGDDLVLSPDSAAAAARPAPAGD